MAVAVKICGLSDEAAVAAAVEGGVGGGAAMCGFVFFEASPRYVTPARAGQLTRKIPETIIRVGLVVDADDDALAAIVATAGIGMLQLHGAETPGRVKDIRQRFGLPVMKVLPVAIADDLAQAGDYTAIADRLMFDARPPEGAARPGGNALAFDWALLKGKTFALPWILAGGLNADNLAEAVETSGAEFVDVSSGVEDAPGRKNAEKILAFLAAAKGL